MEHVGGTGIKIRPARIDDAPVIAAIYNEGIRDRLATLETSERTAEERREWLAGRDDRHPVFVIERDRIVDGWASLNQFNLRNAYRFVADLSIYVSRSARGQGMGSRLMSHLISEAKQIGYHKLVLSAFPWNEAGMRLYQRHGFREIGVYREQGVLDGRWVDTVIMELILDEHLPPSG